MLLNFWICVIPIGNKSKNTNNQKGRIPISQSTVPDPPECLTDSSFWDENKQSFLDWLRERHNYTPLTIKLLCKQTGGDYNKVMSWYRQRYRYENDRKQYLINTNPFLKMEENKNG